MDTPTDKSKITESPSKYDNLESMSTSELLNGLNKEDATVHKVVKKALPQIKALVDQIIQTIKK